MERSSFDPVELVDCISKLPNDVLQMILSRLSTEEAIRTSVLSKRWEHVWKRRTHLVFDMQRFINSRKIIAVSNRVATLMTKIINNHHGHLESCVIDHYSYQCNNGTLNAWIQSLNVVKQTKHLALRHHLELVNCGEFQDFPPSSFSSPSLASLSLEGHVLKTSNSFNHCQNLKTLKLLCVFASEVGVFNRVLASCTSLKVLVLHICCFKKSGPLKIDNNRLELLRVSSCEDIDGIIVSSTSVHILVIDMNYKRRNFVLTAPRLHFNTNFSLTMPFFPHISYNISEEEKSIGHEELVVTCREFFSASLSVNVDLMNQREVERLRQVLCVFPFRMVKLEISFKKSNAGESLQKKWWREHNKDAFPSSKFRVDTVWMHNFSGSEEEIALATCLISQGTVVQKMMIKTTTSLSASKKLEIETALAKLQELQTKNQWKLSIECL